MSSTVAAFIASRKEDASRRRHELDLFEAETRGMEMLLKQFPSHEAEAVSEQDQDDDVEETRRSGRQPGSISKRWRQILGELWIKYPYIFDDNAVVVTAHLYGINIRPREARIRMDGYARHGLVKMVDDGSWKVTDDAVKKFGLDFRAANGNGSSAEAPDPSMSLPLVEEVQEGR